jgi:hypothetical protein
MRKINNENKHSINLEERLFNLDVTNINIKFSKKNREIRLSKN